MKKKIKNLVSIILILVLASCAEIKEEYLYYYGGNTYTSNCPYSCSKLCSFASHWHSIHPEEKYWEEITVTAEWGEEKGEKIKGDTQATFIRMHELYCVRKDFELPSLEKNKDDIMYIEIWFFDEIIKITDTDKINYISEIIVEADKKDQESGDSNYEYIGEIDVFFKDLPMSFSVGRIMQDKNENLFFSSRKNPNVGKGFWGIVGDWYSVPITIDF